MPRDLLFYGRKRVGITVICDGAMRRVHAFHVAARMSRYKRFPLLRNLKKAWYMAIFRMNTFVSRGPFDPKAMNQAPPICAGGMFWTSLRTLCECDCIAPQINGWSGGHTPM